MPPKSGALTPRPLGRGGVACSWLRVHAGQTRRCRASTIKQHDVEDTTRGTFGRRPAYAASPCVVSWSFPTKRRGAWR